MEKSSSLTSPTFYVDATETSPTDWKYVNEGGATIVFSYNGPKHPKFSGKVLRLRKVPVDQLGQSSPDEPDDPSIAFQSKIISRLLPISSLPTLHTARVSHDWLESLAQAAEEARPISRRNKDQLDISRSKGILATNLIESSGLSVEIKPKWGFLPNTRYLSAELRTIKSRHCRYCMHSNLKAAVGEPIARGYCPLDLYSPRKERVRKAISALCAAWIDSNASINNLRVFLDGTRVNASSDSLSRINTYLNGEDLTFSDPLKALTDALVRAICSDPIFYTLQNLQRKLDALDIEGLKLCSKVQQGESTHSSTSEKPFANAITSEPTLDTWTRFVDQYLASHEPNLNDSISQQDLQFFLLSYLLSATFKDCSVIAKFSPNISDVRLFVIDLDPKNSSRLDKWFEQDQEIVRAFKRWLNTKDSERDVSFCIDDNLSP